METKGDFWTELSKAGMCLAPLYQTSTKVAIAIPIRPCTRPKRAPWRHQPRGCILRPKLLHQIQERSDSVLCDPPRGIGTFLPVKTNDITRHKMHSESALFLRKLLMLSTARCGRTQIISVAARPPALWKASIMKDM
jgi:hypothetical protein